MIKITRGGVLEDTFEVLGLKGQVLGLKAWSPRKLACPQLEDTFIFELLKFCGVPEKFFGRRFFWRSPKNIFGGDLFFFFGDRLKNFCGDLFLGKHLRLCPWSLALSILVLGLQRVCPRKGCPWPRIFFVSLALASSLCSRLHLWK